jgi:hypothetical protein
VSVRPSPVAAPVVVTDAPDMAGVLAVVVGLTPRQLRDLVRKRKIRHSVYKRHLFVRVADVLAALGLGLTGVEGPAAEEWDEGVVVQLAARRRRPQ